MEDLVYSTPAMTERERVAETYARLLAAHGPQGWWPADTPFEMMVGAVLTQACTWRNAERALSALRSAGALSPGAILDMPEDRLSGLIRPAGYHNSKARRLRALSGFVAGPLGGDPGRMSGLATPELREMLLAVHGIGEETADDILVYAAGRAVFVVDAYTRRIASRMGIAPEGARYGELSRLFASAMPPDPAVLGEYHALIVRHAKETCRPDPRCGECVLADICRTGAARGVRSGPGRGPSWSL